MEKTLFNEKINNFIKKIKIENFLNKYLKLEKKGTNYVSICPFHNDKNPSLFISPEKQIWKCFSCDIGGNIISFVKKYKNLDFVNSIKEIENITNLKFDLNFNKYKKNIYNDYQKEFLKLNEAAMNFYVYNYTLLKEHKNNLVSLYFKKRCISNEIINKFLIGYSGTKKWN